MNETLGRRLVGATILIGMGILLPFALIQWLDGPEPGHGDNVRVYEITPKGETRPVAGADAESPPPPDTTDVDASPSPASESEPAEETPATATPAKAPPAEESEPQSPSWWVQVGSFRSEENARTLADELAGDFPTSYSEVEVGGVNYYRVLLGPYADETQAQRAASALAARGRKGQVRREP